MYAFEYKSTDFTDSGRCKVGLEARRQRALGHTWKSIAESTKCCQTNVFRWEKTSFVPDDVKARKDGMGRPRTLTPEQEDFLINDAR